MTNFFVFDGNNIVKYDFDGKEVSRTKESFTYDDRNHIHIHILHENGTLYILLKDEENVYFVDTSDFNVIKIGAVDEYMMDGLEGTGNIINILLKNNNFDSVVMSYDTTTKTLNK